MLAHVYRCTYNYINFTYPGLGSIDVMDVQNNIAVGSDVELTWSAPDNAECPCITYAITVNGIELADAVDCSQTSTTIEASNFITCAVNNVSVIPRSVHPSIGLLEDLEGSSQFIYGPGG